MSNNQTVQQIKAEAVMEFVNMLIDAFESGFIDENTLTISTLHRVAQNYCKDSLGIELPHITEQWGEDTAKLCGFVC